MRLPLRRVVLGLALTGCRSEPCMTAQVLDSGICQVLPSGLVLHYEGEELWASRLQSDGSLELITVLETNVWCDEAVHDPATNTLWWVQQQSWDGTVPPKLVQFDIASDTIEWERDLVFDGLPLWWWVPDLLFHEGALYVGGSGFSDPEASYTTYQSLLTRIDDAGQPVWIQVGYPGFVSPEGPQQPLNGIGQLLGTSSGVSFTGWISGIDSRVETVGTVDPQTGELLWSSSLNRDNFSDSTLVTSDGEWLYLLAGFVGYAANPESGLERRFAGSTVTATTPLGEEQWQTSEYVWSGLLGANFEHAVAGASLIVAAVEPVSDSRIRIQRSSSSSGSFECESPLTGLALDGISEMSLITAGDELVLKTRSDNEDYVLSFALLKPGE